MLLRVERPKEAPAGFYNSSLVRSCIVALEPEDFKEAINIF
jgi:hypothetical protein